MSFAAIELPDRAALMAFFEKMRQARKLPEGKHGVFAAVAKDGRIYAVIHAEDEEKIAPAMTDEKIVRDVTLLSKPEPIPEETKEPVRDGTTRVR